MGTERRCIESTDVYDDGTVERWEGDEADAVVRFTNDAWDDATGYAIGTPREVHFPVSTITKPLRRVTEIVGGFMGDSSHDDRGACIVGCPVTYDGPVVRLESVLPLESQEACVGTPYGRTTRVYRFRIEVQAVPVEDES